MTERELRRAIRECESEPMNLSTLSNLADLYIIYSNMYGGETARGDPQDAAGKIIETNSGTEFLEAINGRPAAGVWFIIDDLMETLKVTNERVYKSVLRRIREL